MTLRIYNPDGKDGRPGTHRGLTPSGSPDAALMDAWRAFDCDPLPTVAENLSAAGRRREKKRGRVTATADRFSALMRSTNPPRTEAEAVAGCVVASWLLSWLLQQLAVSVVKFLWRRWNETSTNGVA